MFRKLLVFLALAATIGTAFVLSGDRQDHTIASASSPQVLAANTGRKFTQHAGMPDPNIVFDQVNAVRASTGLQPLTRNDTLTSLAERRAQDMAEHTIYSHKGSDGLVFDEQLANGGYSIVYGCENLDLEFVTDAVAYVNSWMHSSAGHRECLLNPSVTDAGYAVAALASQNNTDMPSYVVVAIHTTTPEQNR